MHGVTCFVDAMLGSNLRLHPPNMCFRNSHSSRTVSSSRSSEIVLAFTDVPCRHSKSHGSSCFELCWYSLKCQLPIGSNLLRCWSSVESAASCFCWARVCCQLNAKKTQIQAAFLGQTLRDAKELWKCLRAKTCSRHGLRISQATACMERNENNMTEELWPIVKSCSQLRMDEEESSAKWWVPTILNSHGFTMLRPESGNRWKLFDQLSRRSPSLEFIELPGLPREFRLLFPLLLPWIWLSESSTRVKN